MEHGAEGREHGAWSMEQGADKIMSMSITYSQEAVHTAIASETDLRKILLVARGY
jgi:hypothetical protein